MGDDGDQQTRSEGHAERRKFILIHFPDTKGKTAKDADALLTTRGCLLRAVAGYHLPNALRMSIGTEEANKLVVSTLADMMGKT
jgi:histidinol-phosphate aminotransferase